MVQAGPGAHHHAETARRDFDIELTFVAILHLVEVGGLVRDQARQDVEPSGRALGVGEGGDFALEFDRLQQGHDVDAALLEDGALAQIEFEALGVGIQLAHLVEHFRAPPGQEAGVNGVGKVAQAKIDAGGLDLVRFDALQDLG